MLTRPLIIVTLVGTKARTTLLTKAHWSSLVRRLHFLPLLKEENGESEEEEEVVDSSEKRRESSSSIKNLSYAEGLNFLPRVKKARALAGRLRILE
ncbi:ORF950 [White spot syndrome virus]|uniref:Wsv367 n=3 Tax=White spot syndrome virus TaxID=342409 RepID=Q8VAN4_WSSVS|nr:wsv367 [Shrimp white spot syndrome virus]AFX59744.1 wsv367 [White spot syndrome virus]AAL33369.1 wsv367 [Shrimp white spot syndrome virus]AAL89294.1 WSSV426 [Shrimp white spot syndrome virus]ATU83689.1 ORF950 [White spot syndrome virus]AWQ60493.1 wsv367 [Shrimp white spot syndrome virus]